MRERNELFDCFRKVDLQKSLPVYTEKAKTKKIALVMIPKRYPSFWCLKQAASNVLLPCSGRKASITISLL